MKSKNIEAFAIFPLKTLGIANLPSDPQIIDRQVSQIIDTGGMA